MNFDKIDIFKIGLASPEKIREWSKGEVRKPETTNYRTLKPEMGGLFCEKIFGPVKNWECHCGKYKRARYKGIICDRCGVEVTKAKVRRERIGHIELAVPVSHIWYSRGEYGDLSSTLSLLLDMSPRALEKVLYFISYIVINPGYTNLYAKQLLNEKEYRDALGEYGNTFRVGMGAEAIKEILQNVNLDELSAELSKGIKENTGQEMHRMVRRLEVVEAFRKSGNKPEWMILDVIPVIPQDLRPMLTLDGGRFWISDLNELYRNVINKNNRLKKQLDLRCPDIIVRYDKRMLQESVDALINNGRWGRPVTGPGNRILKSLSDMLKGKQGRFRQNLLGKRVDYSGCSVIVTDPDLKVFQCGLPKEMALELFKPFVMKKLVSDGLAHNIKSAKSIVEEVKTGIWSMLEDVIKEHPVLLSRTPAINRFNVQAFEPVLIDDKTIKISPLLCNSFRVRNNGEIIKVHVPLSFEAQTEARLLMLSSNNVLGLKDGRPVVSPTQDMVMGIYYLTIHIPGEKGEGKRFSDYNEMFMAYQLGEISLHAMVKVRFKKECEKKIKTKIIDNTVGRFIFNDSMPQDLGFVDRTDEQNLFTLEYDPRKTDGTIIPIDKKMLNEIVVKCYRKKGVAETSLVLDEIKRIGFSYATKGAITIGITDIAIPKKKKELLSEADFKLADIYKLFKRGFISDYEKYLQVVETWEVTKESITDASLLEMDRLNPIYMMVNSGARGSVNQIRQLAGMFGFIANASGMRIEMPIRANFKEGLNTLEFILAAFDARRAHIRREGITWMSYVWLLRRLINASHTVKVSKYDCGTEDGLWITEIRDGYEIIESLEDRLVGRFTAEDILHPETGKIIVAKEELITNEIATTIVSAGIQKVFIRSILNCRTRHGVCSKCYGSDLSTGRIVCEGESVGVIAAQSLGEPLFLDAEEDSFADFFYSKWDSIMRLEELFEAKKPNGLAKTSEVSGRVRINDLNKREVMVTSEDGESEVYRIPYGFSIKVKDGQMIEKGDQITEGTLNPHDVLEIKGIAAAQTYLLREIQKVYSLQGIAMADKHIEVVVRKMLSKVKIYNAGDTDLLRGELCDMFKYEDINNEIADKGKERATGKRTLLGITKVALATDSFLSAASFYETTRVLKEAAIKGMEDPLVGLNENVIVGNRIPVGTGMNKYKDISVVPYIE